MHGSCMILDGKVRKVPWETKMSIPYDRKQKMKWHQTAQCSAACLWRQKMVLVISGSVHDERKKKKKAT